MKRVVVDTNIFISAVFWKGTPGRVVSVFTAHRATLLLSQEILDELARKLDHPKFSGAMLAIGRSAAQIADDFRRLAEVVEMANIPLEAVRDPKDRIILATAVGGKADMLVSGDKDLTTLKAYQGIPILTPAEFLDTMDSVSDESTPPTG